MMGNFFKKAEQYPSKGAKRKKRGLGTKIVDVVSVGVIRDVSARTIAKVGAGSAAGTIMGVLAPVAAVGTLQRFGQDIDDNLRKLKRRKKRR